MFEIQKRKENGDATLYYMDIIKKAVLRAGKDARDSYSFDFPQGSDVVALSPTIIRHIKKLKPRTVSIWFQGVGGLEYLHYGECGRFKRIERFIVLSIYEWLALKKSAFNFFVSRRMLEFYRKTYGYKKDNYVIMPCFNDQIQDDSFQNEKYKKPSFVYAGNLAKWQCFPQMIDLYKKIKEQLPNAELTVYTADQDEARLVLKQKGVEASIKYVPYQQLGEEIKSFKYGFLVREDDIVNNVATPTKMCNYLANGIIPVFSNVIGDFKEELSNLTYSIPLGINFEGIEKLYELEKREIKASDVKADFQTMFNKYYSEEYYINLISHKIRKFIK